MAKGFKKKYFSLAAIAATVSMVSLHAQAAAVHTIEKIVVSADKSEEALEDVTDDVTVITANEIAEHGWRTLPEALRETTGLDIVQSGGPGQPTSLYLQGLKPDQTLILIDGIRFNDPTGLNGGQLELIDLSNVQRIEIIKGPQSGVWGADAMGGVINILTKSAQKGTSGGWMAEGGSYTTLRGSANLYKSTDNGYFGVSVSRYQTNGFSAYGGKRGEAIYGTRASDLPFEDDGYENSQISLKAGANLANDTKFYASLTKILATVHYDNFGADAPDGPFTINKIDDTLYKVGISSRLGIADLDLHYQESTFDRSQFGGYAGNVKELEGKAKFDYGLGRAQVGAGWQRFFQEKSAGVVTNSGYQNHYLFATNSNKFDRFIFTEALRYDSYNAFDSKLTYKLGVKAAIYEDIWAAANVATGYKAPSIFQLHYNATTSLNPEKSLGYNVMLGNGFLKLTFFKNRVKDLITYTDPDWDYTTPNDYYYNAPGTSKFQGYEVELHKDFFDQLYAQLGYTYLSAKDAQGKRLPRRAKQKISYSLSWYPSEKHTINISGYYVGDRFDSNGAKIGNYNVTNLTLSHNFAKHITGFIRIDNLFNRFYQELDGYTTPDRSYYIGLRASY